MTEIQKGLLYRSAFKFLAANKEPPEFMLCHPMKLNEDRFSELQEWILNNCPFIFATGIGLVEAAITMVDSWIENGECLDIRDLEK